MLSKLTPIFLFVLAFASFSAQADTDYRCLNECIKNGGSATACLTQCSYNNPKINEKIIPQNKNRELVVPVPIDSVTLPSAKTPTIESPSKDYACRTQCLKSGKQYKYCDGNCIKGRQSVGQSSKGVK